MVYPSSCCPSGYGTAQAGRHCGERSGNPGAPTVGAVAVDRRALRARDDDRLGSSSADLNSTSANLGDAKARGVCGRKSDEATLLQSTGSRIHLLTKSEYQVPSVPMKRIRIFPAHVTPAALIAKRDHPNAKIGKSMKLSFSDTQPFEKARFAIKIAHARTPVLAWPHGVAPSRTLRPIKPPCRREAISSAGVPV
jgi:hypothetical protein